MPSENALLSLLSYQFSYPEPGVVVGMCPELQGLIIRGDESDMTRLNALLNNEAKKRIECGELPQFGGQGRDLLVLSRSVQKARTQILWIRDQWCSFSSNQLSDNAKWVAQDWIQRVGTTFRVGKAEEKHSIISLAQLICRKVKQARKQYLQDKVAWELKLANARLENEKRDKSDAAIRAMIDWLVAEAQRYMVSGGRLRELGNTKPPGNTPAETWHLMSFEQFNKRAVPQQIHKEETKDANGDVVKGRTWCENPGGGEIAAAVEQSHFMLRGIDRKSVV